MGASGLCRQTLAGLPHHIVTFGCVPLWVRRDFVVIFFCGRPDQILTFGRVPLWVHRDFVVKLWRGSRSDGDVRTCPVVGAWGLCRQTLAGIPIRP